LLTESRAMAAFGPVIDPFAGWPVPSTE
jgi:hypothetical protein